MKSNFFTVAPGSDLKGRPFGSVCLSARARNSKTIATIDLITQEGM